MQANSLGTPCSQTQVVETLRLERTYSANNNLKVPEVEESLLLVGYHGELKVNLFHNTRVIWGFYYPEKVKGYLLYF